MPRRGWSNCADGGNLEDGAAPIGGDLRQTFADDGAVAQSQIVDGAELTGSRVPGEPDNPEL